MCNKLHKKQRIIEDTCLPYTLIVFSSKFEQKKFQTLILRLKIRGLSYLILGLNKDHKIYVGRSSTVHNLLFCAHTLWPNYVTVTYLLVSSSGTNHDLLCLVHGQLQGQNSKQKHRTNKFAMPNEA